MFMDKIFNQGGPYFEILARVLLAQTFVLGALFKLNSYDIFLRVWIATAYPHSYCRQ